MANTLPPPAVVTEIAARSSRDPSTIRRVFRGGGSSTTRASVAPVAAALGYPLPRHQAPSPSPFPSPDGSTSPPGPSSPRWGA